MNFCENWHGLLNESPVRTSTFGWNQTAISDTLHEDLHTNVVDSRTLNMLIMWNNFDHFWHLALHAHSTTTVQVWRSYLHFVMSYGGKKTCNLWPDNLTNHIRLYLVQNITCTFCSTKSVSRFCHYFLMNCGSKSETFKTSRLKVFLKQSKSYVAEGYQYTLCKYFQVFEMLSLLCDLLLPWQRKHTHSLRLNELMEWFVLFLSQNITSISYNTCRSFWLPTLKNPRTWGPSSHSEYGLGYVLNLWHWKCDGERTNHPLKSLP